MDGDGMNMLLRASTEAERFALVTEDLEQLIWRYVLSPSALHGVPGAPAIQEIGAIVEIMPNIYIHSVRLILDKHPHHFIRVWGVMQHPNGSVEESPLLVAYSNDFPDETITSFKIGMNTNLAWYEEIRATFLSALAARRKARQLPSGAGAPPAGLGQQQRQGAAYPRAGWIPAAEVQQLLESGDMQALTAFIERHSRPDLPAIRTPTGGPVAAGAATMKASNGPASTAPPSTAPLNETNGALRATPADTAELAEMRRQTKGLFDEWKQLREAAYKQRDTLDLKLKAIYFTLYPFMREAARYTGSFNLEAAVATWIQEGCPPPREEVPAALPPGVTVDVIPFDETRAQQIADAVEEAKRLAAEYEQAKVQVQERSRILERICEIAGGHRPQTGRDETGTPYTVCDRCGARLNTRMTDRRDSWLE